MERVMFLEILDRRGQVRQRLRINSLPLQLGRAYHNDAILDDAYVSPVHAQIDVSGGQLILRDLGSENGVGLGRDILHGEACPVSVPCEFRLGRTRCRIRDARHEVAPTLRAPSDLGVGRLLQHPWLGALLVGAVIATTAMEALGHARRDIDWGHLAEEFLTTGLVLAVWVGLWALVTRVLTPRTRFLGHWIVVACYTLFEAGLGWAGGWLRFLVASITPLQIFEIGLSLAVACLVFYAHISLTGALRTSARVLVAVLLGTAFVSINQLDTVFRRPDWVQVLPYWSRLQPIDPRWLPSSTVDGFFEETAELRAALDANAENAKTRRVLHGEDSR